MCGGWAGALALPALEGVRWGRDAALPALEGVGAMGEVENKINR